jgi:hypothetical protein
LGVFCQSQASQLLASIEGLLTPAVAGGGQRMDAAVKPGGIGACQDGALFPVVAGAF